VPRPGDGHAAAVRAAVGPVRAARPVVGGHGPVPVRQRAGRCRAVDGLAGRVARDPGRGAGALASLSFILIAGLYAGRRSAALQGAMAGMMGVAFIAGPLIGGVLTDHVGWRACFSVNLPIGLVALVAIRALLPRSVGRSEGEVPLDL